MRDFLSVLSEVVQCFGIGQFEKSAVFTGEKVNSSLNMVNRSIILRKFLLFILLLKNLTDIFTQQCSAVYYHLEFLFKPFDKMVNKKELFIFNKYIEKSCYIYVVWYCAIVSVQLWNFINGGSKLVGCLARNQLAQRNFSRFKIIH